MAILSFDQEDSPERVIELRSPVAVTDLAALLRRKPVRIVQDLFDLKVMADAAQFITFEMAAKVAEKYGFVAKRAS